MIISLFSMLGYWTVAWALHRPPTKRNTVLATTVIALGFHAAQLTNDFISTFEQISLSTMLTLVAFCMATIGALSYFFARQKIAYLVIALIASIMVWFPVIWPTPMTNTGGWALKLHIFFSITAYIALSFAALYACFLLLQDYRLRQGTTGFNFSISLQDIEKMLISFTRFGEALLTLSLLTGVLFIRDIWAQHVAHKLFFGAVSWLVIGLLLLLHHTTGFRGRPAALLLLGGFISLVLAYFGSTFILQIILHR